MALLRRTVDSAGPVGPREAGPAPKALAGCQTLWEFLFSTVWPGTTELRETGTAKLFTDAGGLKVMFTDNAQSLCAFAVLKLDKPLLDQLDALLSSPTTDWRPVKVYGGKK